MGLSCAVSRPRVNAGRPAVTAYSVVEVDFVTLPYDGHINTGRFCFLDGLTVYRKCIGSRSEIAFSSSLILLSTKIPINGS